MEKHFNEMSEIEWRDITGYIVRVEDNLRNIYLGCTERVINALFFLNAGGVVTILGLKNLNIKTAWLSWSLYAFLFGLVFAFILVVYDYLILWIRVNKLNHLINKFFSNKIFFSEIQISRSKKYYGISAIFIGLFSGTGWITGLFFGIYGYLN